MKYEMQVLRFYLVGIVMFYTNSFIVDMPLSADVYIAWAVTT